jgi:tetratricopeptide (TPR) repeat protein
MNDWQDAERRIERAFQLGQSQRWHEALTEIESALIVDPENAAWLAGRGYVLDQLERFDEAIDAYREALEQDEDDVDVQTAMGMDLIRIGLFHEAIQVFEQLSKAHPDYEPAYCHRIAAYVGLSDHEQAEAMFYLSQQVTDECPTCYYYMGISLYERGDYDRAIYCWSRTLNFEYDYPAARQRIAEAYRAAEDYNAAKKHYLEELRRSPGNVVLMNEMAGMMVEQGDAAGATTKCLQALELDPDYLPARVLLGEIHLADDLFSEAVDALEAAFLMDPDYPGLRLRLAEAWMGQGRHEEARQALDYEANRFPNDAEVRMALGTCLYEMGDTDRADVCFREVLESNGESEPAHLYRGLCAFRQERDQEGIEHCLQALDQRGDDVPTMYKLVLAYVKLGQFSQARQMNARLQHAEPDHPLARSLRKGLGWMLLVRCLKGVASPVHNWIRALPLPLRRWVRADVSHRTPACG